MRLILLLVCAALVLGKKQRHHRAPTPPVSIIPTLQPVPAPPPTTRVWKHTPDQYNYYSDLYAQRANFLYKFFPHSGPSFYSAQGDMAKSRWYAYLAKQEAAELALVGEYEED